MFKAAILLLVFVTVLGAPGAAGAQQHDAHEPYWDAGHESHGHKSADPGLVELNRRYDAAWAEWRGKLFDVDVAPGMVVADIGAGAGDLSMLMAQKVGPEGLVYANEIDAKQLARIGAKAAQNGLENVVPVLGREDDTMLPPGQVDLAVMVEVLHHVSGREAFLENLRARVKTGARLVVIEADARQAGGTPKGCYTHPDEARRLVEHAGFRFVDQRSRNIEGCIFFVLTAVASR